MKEDDFEHLGRSTRFVVKFSDNYTRCSGVDGEEEEGGGAKR